LPDPELLERANQQGRVLFTRDDDFLTEAARLQGQQRAFCGIIFAHQLRVSIGQCVADLELIAKAYEPQDMANRVEHLPLR
jgi:predicted nuclease of predicted toxin-antitoxin system